MHALALPYHYLINMGCCSPSTNWEQMQNLIFLVCFIWTSVGNKYLRISSFSFCKQKKKKKNGGFLKILLPGSVREFGLESHWRIGGLSQASKTERFAILFQGSSSHMFECVLVMLFVSGTFRGNFFSQWRNYVVLNYVFNHVIKINACGSFLPHLSF